MEFNFIICEYNPLHNGHIYHMNKTKNNPDDKIICIMSGNCVQRGELAIADKYTRAKWAIEAGADMVIELPSRFVLAPAQIFAIGATKIISHFKNESTLCFGSECGDIKLLKEIANLLDNEDINKLIKTNLNSGSNYPKAVNDAFSKYSKNNNLNGIDEILNNPNNTLAIEYLKALNCFAPKVLAKTVLRENNYNKEFIDGNFASASAIRANLSNKDLINAYCPSFVVDTLPKKINYEDRLFALLKYNLSDSKKWTNICGVSEGIENRISEKLDTSNTFNELVEEVKSKRYTLARIKRLLLNGLINNTYSMKDLQEKNIDYIKVLAIKKSSKELLSMFDIPIITNSRDYKVNQISENILDKNIDRLYKSTYYKYTDKFVVFE